MKSMNPFKANKQFLLSHVERTPRIYTATFSTRAGKVYEMIKKEREEDTVDLGKEYEDEVQELIRTGVLTPSLRKGVYWINPLYFDPRVEKESLIRLSISL